MLEPGSRREPDRPEPARPREPAEGRRLRAHAGGDQLSMCLTIEPEQLNGVGDVEEWEEVRMIVDSGAAETVVSREMVKAVAVQESDGSRRGVLDEVANGERIPTEGETSLLDGQQTTRGGK